MLNVNIINRSAFALPQYESEQAAGMDLRFAGPEKVTLKPLERGLFPTGLFIELPIGYEAQVRPRSGLALKKGLTVLNTPGTIDADYRGEIGVILINLSTENIDIEPGDRIAQMVVSKHERVEWKPVEQISQTQRGEGGFGHSGKK